MQEDSNSSSTLWSRNKALGHNDTHVFIVEKFLKEPERKWNRSNTYRVAIKKGIGNPRELTLDVIQDALQFCRLQMAEARKHATPSRDEMMKDILLEAQENENRKL